MKRKIIILMILILFSSAYSVSAMIYTGFNFSVGGQDSQPIDIYFNGSNFYIVGDVTDRIYQYNSSGNCTGFNFSVSSKTDSPYGITSNGSSFFIVGLNEKKVFEFNFSGNYTGFNFSTASQANEFGGITYYNNSFYIVEFSGGANVYRYLANGSYSDFTFDVSINDTFTRGITANRDNFFITGTEHDNIYRYNVSGNYKSLYNVSEYFEWISGITSYDNSTFYIIEGGGQDNVLGFNLDVTPPTYSDWKNNASSETSRNGTNVNFSINLTDGEELNSYIFAHNLSKILTNGTATSISGDSYLVSEIITVNLTRGNYICGQFWFDDTSRNINQTNMSCFTVANTIPTITTAIEPSPAEATEDLNGTITFTDVDNDINTQNETRWYNNSKHLTLVDNNLTLGKGNYSVDDIIIFSARSYDGYNWSSWINSSSLTIGDSTPPDIFNITFSATSLYSDETMNATINCTDVSSSISFARMEINSSGTMTNYSMSSAGGDIYYKAQTYGVGTYTVTNFYCKDTSGNLNKTPSGQILTVTTRPTVTPPGGGGGGEAPEPKIIIELTCETDEDCKKFGETYVCIQGFCLEFEPVCNYNGICEPGRGEHVGNCGDEYVNGTLIIEGDCHWTSPRDILKMAVSSQYFLWVMLIMFVVLIIVLNAMKEESFVKRKYRTSIRWIKKYIRR